MFRSSREGETSPLGWLCAIQNASTPSKELTSPRKSRGITIDWFRLPVVCWIAPRSFPFFPVTTTTNASCASFRRGATTCAACSGVVTLVIPVLIVPMVNLSAFAHLLISRCCFSSGVVSTANRLSCTAPDRSMFRLFLAGWLVPAGSCTVP